MCRSRHEEGGEKLQRKGFPGLVRLEISMRMRKRLQENENSAQRMRDSKRINNAVHAYSYYMYIDERISERMGKKEHQRGVSPYMQ